MCDGITAYGGSVEALEKDAGERWRSKRWLDIPFTPPPFSATDILAGAMVGSGHG